MNLVCLMGRLTRDPDVRENGENITARYTLAVDRRSKEKKADFIGCVSFGKTATFVKDYLKQGVKVVAEGRIQTGSYTKQSGEKVYTTDVVVESLEFAESKKADFIPADDFADDDFPFK